MMLYEDKNVSSKQIETNTQISVKYKESPKVLKIIHGYISMNE